MDLYNEISSSQSISSSVLEIIKNSWGINIYDEKDDFDNTDLLVGVNSDIYPIHLRLSTLFVQNYH